MQNVDTETKNIRLFDQTVIINYCTEEYSQKRNKNSSLDKSLCTECCICIAWINFMMDACKTRQKKIRSGVCTYMVKKGENKRIQNQDLESGSGTSI